MGRGRKTSGRAEKRADQARPRRASGLRDQARSGGAVAGSEGAPAAARGTGRKGSAEPVRAASLQQHPRGFSGEAGSGPHAQHLQGDLKGRGGAGRGPAAPLAGSLRGRSGAAQRTAARGFRGRAGLGMHPV